LSIKRTGKVQHGERGNKRTSNKYITTLTVRNFFKVLSLKTHGTGKKSTIVGVSSTD
jgi:hypothetical protein